jgi:hypothetical protein
MASRLLVTNVPTRDARSRTPLPSISFAAVLVAGCGGATSEAGAPFELPALARRKIEVEGIRGEVEASATPFVRNGADAIAVRIPVGTATPIDCQIPKGNVFAGETLPTVIRELAGTVRVTSLGTTDVAVIGDHVAIFLDMSFEFERPGEPRGPGELKAMFFDHPATPLLCLNADVGHRAMFERITKDFAATLESDEPAGPSPELVEAYVERFDGAVSGFSRREVLAGEQGSFVSNFRAASFVPLSARELEMSDVVESEIWDSDGRLVQAAYAARKRGHLDFDIRLHRVGAQEYRIRGKRSDQNVSLTFQTKGARGLATDTMLSKMIAGDLLSGKTSETRVEEYRPMVDPSGPIEVVYKTESKDQRQLRISAGSAYAIGTADEQGRLEKLVIAGRRSTSTLERVLLHQTR